MLGMLVLTGVLVYATGMCARNTLRYQYYSKQVTAREHQLTHLESDIKQFKRQEQAMASDAYWELEAKIKLGYIHPNERVYKFYSGAEK